MSFLMDIRSTAQVCMEVTEPGRRLPSRAERTTARSQTVAIAPSGAIRNGSARCRWIVACDAAEDCGQTYGDLANAALKIRIDLSVRDRLREFSSAAGRYRCGG
jgi:hypothetical protein